jgi:4-phospho-D-threonate 3-dehydrogenase / 4-phospho-D-erythronate 3-dehydrogenase
MKPIIALTIGDFNGIGPEIVLRSISEPDINALCRPVLVGPYEIWAEAAKQFIPSANLIQIEDEKAIGKKLNGVPVLHIEGFSTADLSPGRPSRRAGGAAVEAIKKSLTICQNKIAHAMVTAPVSKESINLAGHAYVGHTDMLMDLTNTEAVTMIMVAGSFRIGLVTVHVPIRAVSETITERELMLKTKTAIDSLRRDFGIIDPRVAVLGLNPHAGESGLLGDEEKEVITPTIKRLIKEGYMLEGPFPADGFFGAKLHHNFDLVMAMYHDQGLIPLKLEGFEFGVNFSAGLPVVRTSPDHGTAYNIVGRGIANLNSTTEAIKLAVSVAHNRTAKAQ